jgi:hypothetical protein
LNHFSSFSRISRDKTPTYEKRSGTMSYWEYCEVGWAPRQITIHVYSGRVDGGYEGVQEPQEWGSLLAQLGADGWELVGVVPSRPATHTLYYFKRPLDPPEVIEREKQEQVKAEQEWRKKLEEWEQAPPGTPLHLHHAILMKSTPRAGEPTEEPRDAQSRTGDPESDFSL